MAYDFLGCHKGEKDGKKGFFFRVWAKNAQEISVVGDFNNWDRSADPMEMIGDSEVWEAFIENAKEFDTYKYAVSGCDGKLHMKADPYGTHMENVQGRRYFRLTIINGQITSGSKLRQTKIFMTVR